VIVNVNARLLDNGHVYVQYQEDGKAKNAGFANWAGFISWLTDEVNRAAQLDQHVRDRPL